MTKHLKHQSLNAIAAMVSQAVLLWNPLHFPAQAWMLCAAFFFGAMFGQSIKAIVVEDHLLRMNTSKKDAEYILGND